MGPKKSTSRKKASRKRVEKETVQPSRFMDLPIEIRLMIYRLAVVKPKCQWGADYYTLRPPALAQVSKQIRTEVLPIYYGENSFNIDLDIDVIEYDQEDTPIRQKNDTKLNEFLRKCSSIVKTGGLEHIKKLDLDYSEPVWGDLCNYLFGFELVGTAADGRKDKKNRVGDDNLDWNDYQAVKRAVHRTTKRVVHDDCYPEIKYHVPIDNIIRVLFTLAKHCPRANQYVELSWDYGH